ncbi:MAG: hypothetical protein JSR54_05695 [Proteobacteria bacterium]|nr:hypothetical protein [Pseudomonadota bacterium]
MQIAVDISLYPLTADYIPPIKGFIERLQARPGLALEYNSLSTQVRGDLDTVFEALREEIRTAFAGRDRAVVVLKVIGGPVPPAGA